MTPFKCQNRCSRRWSLGPFKETPFIAFDGNAREKYQFRDQKTSKTLMLDDFSKSNSSDPSNRLEPPAECSEEVPQVPPTDVEGEAPGPSSKKAELQEPEEPAAPSTEEA